MNERSSCLTRTVPGGPLQEPWDSYCLAGLKTSWLCLCKEELFVHGVCPSPRGVVASKGARPCAAAVVRGPSCAVRKAVSGIGMLVWEFAFHPNYTRAPLVLGVYGQKTPVDARN